MNAIHEEIVHRTVQEINLGKDEENIVISLQSDYGSACQETSSDNWKMPVDKTEAEAYVKIKIIDSTRTWSSCLLGCVPLVHGRVGVRFGKAGEETHATRPT